MIISGCSNPTATNDSATSSYGDTERTLLEKAQLTNENISKISLEYSQIEDFGDYYSFLCEAEGVEYEGMAIISNGEVRKFDLAKVDTKPAFTVHTFSGSIINDDKSKSLFFACSGVINDEKIKKLHVFLSGDIIYEVQLGDMRTYNIMIADRQPTILKIEAIDEKDTIIHSFPSSLPEKTS